VADGGIAEGRRAPESSSFAGPQVTPVPSSAASASAGRTRGIFASLLAETGRISRAESDRIRQELGQPSESPLGGLDDPEERLALLVFLAIQFTVIAYFSRQPGLAAAFPIDEKNRAP
jgi:hypothetical protein